MGGGGPRGSRCDGGGGGGPIPGPTGVGYRGTLPPCPVVGPGGEFECFGSGCSACIGRELADGGGTYMDDGVLGWDDA